MFWFTLLNEENSQIFPVPSHLHFVVFTIHWFLLQSITSKKELDGGEYNSEHNIGNNGFENTGPRVNSSDILTLKGRKMLD